MLGDRLKLARKKAGLSLRGLAEALGGKVTAQAIGKYERGEMLPSSGVLIALSKVLGVSLPYLMDTQGIALTGVDFRTKANTTARERAQVETEVIEWVERYLQVERILGLDSAQWESAFERPLRLEVVQKAERLADEVREKWQLGLDPIPNMTELLEERGLKVLTVTLPLRVSGFTCTVRHADGKPGLPVVVVNDRHSLERRRLTLAHELAHRVIDASNLAKQEEERAATMFGGAFLMPGDHLMREIGNRRHALGYKELIDIKRLYRVSGAALLVRLRDLGIISQPTLVYAFQGVARGWRTDEPEELERQEERGQRERARRFERLCYRALAEGLISLIKAAELLRRPIAEVEAELKGPWRAEK
jgi:Zn-dependent peptidase ImmA (M78 family)